MGNLIFTTLYILLGILAGSPAFADEVNIIKNPGFESRTAQWSKTGSSTFTIESAAPLTGNYSAIWDPSATGEFFRSTTYTIPAGLKGATCVVQMKYLWDSGTSDHIRMNVDDGTNDVAQVSLDPTSGGVPRTAQISFTCPTSGTLRFELESTANAAAITLEDVFVGTGKNTVQLSQTELYAAVQYHNISNCDVTITSGTIAEVANDTDCTSRTAVGQAQFVNNQFKMSVAKLPKGRYELSTMVPVYSDTSGTTCEFYVRAPSSQMNVTYGAVGFITGLGSNAIGTMVNSIWQQTTDATNVEFYMEWRRTAGAGSCHMGTTSAGGATFSMSLKKYPTQSAEALTLDTLGWYVDATISGANPAMSNSSVAAYSPVENSGLTLTQTSGSIPTQIPCTPSNPSTGTTCSAGNEAVGVVFNLPTAGQVLACVSFGVEISTGASGSWDGAFQVVETSNTSNTIVQEGKSRLPVQNRVSNSIVNQPVSRLCGTFNFTSAGQKTLRLMYEVSAVATVNSSIILADESGAQGQRNIHWEVYPINQQMPAPVFTAINQKVNTLATGVRVMAASIAAPSAGTCVVNSEPTGDFVNGTPVAPGTGQCTVLVNAGVFSAAPTCTCTTRTNGSTCSLTAISTSSISTRTVLGTSGADDNTAIDLVCVGLQ